jgi:hypothetical protein
VAGFSQGSFFESPLPLWRRNNSFGGYFAVHPARFPIIEHLSPVEAAGIVLRGGMVVKAILPLLLIEAVLVIDWSS